MLLLLLLLTTQVGGCSMSTVQSKHDDQVPTVNTSRERIISILPIPAELQKYSDVKVGFLGKSSFDS